MFQSDGRRACSGVFIPLSSALPIGPLVCLPSACGYLDSLGPCTGFWFPGSGVAPPLMHACLPFVGRGACHTPQSSTLPRIVFTAHLAAAFFLVMVVTSVVLKDF